MEKLELLIREAKKAMKRAIAPYSNFRVGVSVLARNRIYTGCNIENPSLMLSECAERVALLKALSEGEKQIKSILIISSDGDYCYPCGSCRQLIYEFAPDADIYIASSKGIKKYNINELLPYGFRREGDED
ncbi:MAG: cytidine deaminase [Nitrospirae bacterium]|nr:cytidine deaminase [Nitrospirota bacterium]